MAYVTYVIFTVVQAGKPWIAVVLAVISAPPLIIVGRTAFAGAWATDRGICVRNIRRTLFVPWEEIDRFVVGSHGIWPKVAILERQDGERVVMWAIQGPNPVTRPGNEAAERVVERLNAGLREHRAAAVRQDDESQKE